MFGLPLQAVARILMWLAVIALLLAAFVCLMRWLRERNEADESTSGDLLTSFRDIHERGQLSEEEYQTIRRRLAAKMQGELKHDDDRS